MGDAMKFVFCEGKNDVLVLSSLVSHLDLDIKVEEYGGKDKVLTFLHGLRNRPEFVQQKIESMAILRDADADATAAFTSVRAALLQNSFEAPDAVGTFKQSSMRVGVFIIGVNGRGMIEDLCLNSISNRPEYQCIDTYFACITERSGRTSFTSKAKLRVWMASQADHEYYVGRAAEEGYWPWESPAFDSLKDFLKAL
jgi:hypothetical protein